MALVASLGVGGGLILRRLRAASATGTALALMAAAPALAHAPEDPLHGGEGEGLTVLGHSDLGGTGLNGEVDVLGDYAYVGVGTNGGFAAQWNKAPTCEGANKVKVVSLKDPADPEVVSTIDLTGAGEEPGATLARAVSVIEVKPHGSSGSFAGDLLAVALESCRGGGRLGVDLYDVSDPSKPILVGTDTPVIGTATRDVSLVQRPDGRVLALEANQSGSVRAVDVTVPRTPIPVGARAAPAGAQGCRPFNFAQGVVTNAAGSRAYAAYQDGGLMTLDISSPMPGATFPKLAEARYEAFDEGNSFRFVPNPAETAALATDEDLLPATTTLTVATGPASLVTEPGGSGPGVFRGCEAIWGDPLYRQTSTSLADRQVVFAGANGCEAGYAGLNVEDKIVMVDRGGSGACFDFDGKARIAQEKGAAALLIANTSSTALMFSPDATLPVDAGVTIPVVLIRKEAGDAVKAGLANNQTVTGTLADTADTWGALRVFDLPKPPANPRQVAVFNAPHTRALTPGNGLYHAVNALWDGNSALVAWMSDGLRVVDLSDRSAPKPGPFYVPPGVADPTGNYGAVPLVVDVAKHGKRVVISDINGGLYVLATEDELLPGAGSLADCLSRPANLIRGTSAANLIKGTRLADRIFAGAGNDRVNALAGDDCLDLHVGADRGQGAAGADVVAGRSGPDRVRGGTGNDTVLGQRGNDLVVGGPGADLLRGASGRDRLSGGGGSDRIGADAGADRLGAGSGKDRVQGGSGKDRVNGGSGEDRVNGGSGNDVLRGQPGNDRLNGGKGRDRLSGGRGRDRIVARDGRSERISCGKGRDLVIADRTDRVARDCERVRRQRRARERRRKPAGPGRVTGLRARALSSTEIALRFRAPAGGGRTGAAARRYLVKQSLAPIKSRRAFARARALCDGNCRFDVTSVGQAITLRITDLTPNTTYYYAVAARDNASGRPGPRSRVVKATTR